MFAGHCFQPFLLFCLGGQARIDDLRVDQDEADAIVIEGLVMRPEVFVPECQEIVADHAGRAPVDGLVADVVVAGNDVELVAQVLDLILEVLGGLLIKMRDGGHGVQKVAQMQHEIDLAGVQIADHMPHPPVGHLIGLERRIAFCLALVQVGVGDDRIGKKPGAQVVVHACPIPLMFRPHHSGEFLFVSMILARRRPFSQGQFPPTGGPSAFARLTPGCRSCSLTGPIGGHGQ